MSLNSLEERGLEVVDTCSKCGKPAKLTDGSPLRALVRMDAEEPKLICPVCWFGRDYLEKLERYGEAENVISTN